MLSNKGIQVKKINSKGRKKKRELYYNKINKKLTMKKKKFLSSKEYKVEVNNTYLNSGTIMLKNNKQKKHKINRSYKHQNVKHTISKGAEFFIPSKLPQ